MFDASATTRIRKNLVINGRRTTVSLETAIWDSLTDICRREEISLDELCEATVEHSGPISMSSALRIASLRYFRAMSESHETGGSFRSAVSEWIDRSAGSRRTVPDWTSAQGKGAEHHAHG